jgi:selenocysteine lyase/cysteine desulfurase
MLGPIGAGFLFIRRDLLTCLEPVMSGWRSVVDRDDYFCYDSPLRSTGERFEPGSLNNVGLLGMEAAMELLLDVGLGVIENRILALTDSLIESLQSRRCVITTPMADPRERSGIVCFRHPEKAPEVLSQRFRDAGVIVSQRGDVIRVSPHFYNTEGELGRLLDALPA